MSTNEYSADLRDIRFVLLEQLEMVEKLSPYFEGLDTDVVDSFLDGALDMSVELLHPMNAPGDHHGCTLDGQGNVSTPEGYKEAWDALAENGFFSVSAPEKYGGLGMPHTIDVAMGEMFTGSCMAFALYPGLSRATANLLSHFGDEKYKDMACEKLFSGQWGGTMCLTEAGAGSDVGENRAKAIPRGDGSYALTGEKIFISSGDQDLTENILHLVLARTPNAPKGTKGLGIFLVPKFLFDDEGNIGKRNDIFVTGIEEKMGIHGSATCTLSMGGNDECVGYILGGEQQGMQIMFTMMNEARIEVAVQGLAGASAAYEYAKAYAAERIQGSDISRFGDPDAPRVSINHHPDVRRMLMTQKVWVETMRSFIYTTAVLIDQMMKIEDATEKRNIKGQIELMTPILKSYCSDRGFDSTVLALQTFGGYGYCSEYPVEQLVRDTKIASIYEGTNGIQAMDLLGRKMRKANGALFMTWMKDLGEEVKACSAHEELKASAEAIDKASKFLGKSAMHLGGLGMKGNLKGAMLQATPFLDQFGCVVLGLHALRQARVALEKNPSLDDPFYKGKILNVKFYVANMLPQSVALGKQITSNDESCLDPSLFV